MKNHKLVACCSVFIVAAIGVAVLHSMQSAIAEPPAPWIVVLSDLENLSSPPAPPGTQPPLFPISDKPDVNPSYRLRGLRSEESCACDEDCLGSWEDSCGGFTYIENTCPEWIECDGCEPEPCCCTEVTYECPDENACFVCEDYGFSCCCYANCGEGTASFWGSVNVLVNAEGSLYAAGGMDGYHCNEHVCCGAQSSQVAKYNQLTGRFEWFKCTCPEENPHCATCHSIGEVKAMASFGDVLYIGGAWNGCADDPNKMCIHGRMARWNGCAEDWGPVGGSSVDDGLNNRVNSLAVYNGELYAGGIFTDLNGLSGNALLNIARWTGEEWLPVGGGISKYGTHSGQVLVLKVIEGEPGLEDGLYVAGSGLYKAVNPNGTQVTINTVARWDGTEWHSVANPAAPRLNTVHALAAYQGQLYVGGEFDIMEPAPSYRHHYGVAKLAGGEWAGVSTGVYTVTDIGGEWWPGYESAYYGRVYALEVYQGRDNQPWLYVGGDFDMAGGVVLGDMGEVRGVNASGLARWNGVAWQAVGNGLAGNYKQAHAFLPFDLGNGVEQLIIGGGFDAPIDCSHRQCSANIAKWR